MRRRGRETRPADAAAVEMLDEAGGAYPRLEPAPIRVGGPVAAVRTERGIAHEGLSQQADQVLAIYGIHSTDDTARTEKEQPASVGAASLCR